MEENFEKTEGEFENGSGQTDIYMKERAAASLGEFQKKYLLRSQDYGILYPYIVSEQVTDIHWNGRQLWIQDLRKGRYMAKELLSELFVERFIHQAAALSGVSFDREHPVLEAETEELQISIVHGCVAKTGATISLKKIPAVRRMNREEMIRSGYCSEAVGDFLIHCIQAHCTIVICGGSASGKTELLKYLTKFIPAKERVITIEEVLEIHYGKLNPHKDCVEMKVAENFTYGEAIKASMRQLPRWILLSEAKSREVRDFLESLSIGIYGVTTLQADDVRNIPDRLKNMAGGYLDADRIENDIYRFIDIGILVKGGNDLSESLEKEGETDRCVDQICVFDRFGREWKETINQITMLVEDGKLVSRYLPDNILRKFEMAGIRKPFGGKC